MAYTWLGYALCTYIVESTTSGCPSWPRSAPVENDHTWVRFATLSAVMSSSEL